jgi:photosystem I P700 chlorophyll a apoprotein A2
MATKFPKFSQALAQDPATRRIWYGIATAHDLESHDGMTEKVFIKRSSLHILVIWQSSFYGHQATYSTLLGKVTFNNGY